MPGLLAHVLADHIQHADGLLANCDAQLQAQRMGNYVTRTNIPKKMFGI